MKIRRAITTALLLGTTQAVAAQPPESPAGRLAAQEAQFPPWQNGKNDGAANQGLVFTVPPADSLADFHGSLDNPLLVLYASSTLR